MHGTIKTEEELTNAEPAAGGAECPARAVLLDGLVIDARGTAMVPSGPAGAASARYYVSENAVAASGALERIPSNRLDSSVLTMLRRIRLLDGAGRRDDLAAVLRRVVVLEDAIVLHLDKRQCLATWRAQEQILQRLSTGDTLRLIGTCLTQDEEVSEAGTALCLKMPRHSRARKIRGRGRRNALLFRPKI
jgi:hypothetical protein